MELIIFFGILFFLFIWKSSLKRQTKRTIDKNAEFKTVISENELSLDKLDIKSEKESNLKDFGRYISNENLIKRISVPLSKEDENLLKEMPLKGSNLFSDLEKNFERFGVRKTNSEIRNLLGLPDFKRDILILEKIENENSLRLEKIENENETGVKESNYDRSQRLKNKNEQEKDRIIKETIDKYTKELQSVFPNKTIKITFHNLSYIGIRFPFLYDMNNEYPHQTPRRFTTIKFKNGNRLAIRPCPIGCTSKEGYYKYLFNLEGINILSENQKELFYHYPCDNGFGFHLASRKKDEKGVEVYDEQDWEKYI
tara:strand:+ start:96 stop:1031 length:936 start_codon:yes stop_codon:yes gene_type:complete